MSPPSLRKRKSMTSRILIAVTFLGSLATACTTATPHFVDQSAAIVAAVIHVVPRQAPEITAAGISARPSQAAAITAAAILAAPDQTDAIERAAAIEVARSDSALAPA